MKALLPLLLVALGCQAVASADEWPRVREFQASFGIDRPSERIFLLLPIYNYDNEEEYRLVCHGGSTEYLDWLSSETGSNYSGLFRCDLFDTPIIHSESSLLSEDGTAVWHQRGQYHASDLIGDCGDYPEFGRLRHFRLRGFELTLAVEDIILEDDQLVYYVLNVSLREDRSIRSSWTERPGYIRPKFGKCGVVVEGYEPRMCRNRETLLWGPCPDAQ